MQKVLACIDGSQYAESCCQHAGWIASRLNASVEVVYVTDLRQFEVPFIADLSGSLGLQPYQSIMGELQGLEEKKAAIVLSQAETYLREHGFGGEVVQTHKTGFLVDCLSELEESASLVVIGKRGENANFATEHLGSTMERVARAASKPCLVASRAFREIRKVMLSYQDVASCHAAIRYISESGLFSNVEIHLVSVARAENEAEVLDDLKKAEERLVGAGIRPICQMLHGVVAQSLARYAKESEIDLLLMGAYGHSRIRHLIIGSTTTEILRDCRLPTLLFR